MNSTITARIVAGMSVALAALAIAALVSYLSLQGFIAGTREVAHKYDALLAGQRLERAMSDAEWLARGYAITGDVSQRDEMRSVAEQADTVIRELRGLTSDNPAQQARLDRLQELVRQRVASAEGIIRLRDSGVGITDRDLASTVSDGTRITLAVRQVAREIEEDERTLLERHAAATRAAQQRTTRVLLYGSLIAIGLGISMMIWLVRSVRASFDAMGIELEKRQAALAAESWVKSSLARLSRALEGQRQINTVANSALTELAQLLEFKHAALYVPEADVEQPRLLLQGTYAVTGAPLMLVPGERLVGQAYQERRRILLDTVPENYVRIGSALGGAPPRHVLVLPAVLEGRVRGVVELAAFQPFTAVQLRFLDEFATTLAVVLASVANTARTDHLLLESQRLAETIEELTKG